MIEKKDVLNLAGKVAIVTGGAGGLGSGAAEILSAYGAKVAIVDLNEELGKKTEKELRDAGREVKFFRCDITDGTQVEQLVNKVKELYGRIDILFNNAGVVVRKTVVGHTENEWDRVLDVTLKGAFLMSKYVVPVMEEQGGGSIINTGSGWGLKGGDNAVSYCAAKGGIVNMTRGMAIDHGPKNIRVNCVCPGDTPTAMLIGEARQLGVDCDAMLKESADTRPLRRLGEPEDIANAVLFLSSDLSSWITGTHIVVDGGGIA